MTADGTLTYVWDAENRLIEVRITSPAGGSKQVKYQYDYLSRRVEKKVYTYNTGTSQWNTTPTENLRFVYDQFNLVLVLDGLNSNAVKKKFTWGLDLSDTQHGVGGVGGLLSTEEVGSGSPGYWHFYDGNGNVAQVIDSDNNSLVAHYEYDVFGNAITSSGTYASENPFRFSTKYLESENGLYYYGYRYYQARTGRWINRDPIAELGGINLYRFIYNAPTNLYDILGMRSAGDRAGQFLMGAGTFLLSGAAVVGTAAIPGIGPLAAAAVASSAGVGMAWGVGNMAAAFAPESNTALAQKMSNAPSSQAGIIGNMLGGEKGQAAGQLAESAVGVMTGNPQGALEWAAAGADLVGNMAGFGDAFGGDIPKGDIPKYNTQDANFPGKGLSDVPHDSSRYNTTDVDFGGEDLSNIPPQRGPLNCKK